MNLIDAAFAVIKSTDPALYARMRADKDWKVTSGRARAPGADGDTRIGVYGDDGRPRLFPEAERDTKLDTQALRAEARHFNVPADEYAASVLAHEYRHHLGHMEDDAYRESVRMDRRLFGDDSPVTAADHFSEVTADD